MATTSPFNREESILAWEKETTRGTAPSTASAWRDFGRVIEWNDLGPRNAILRDPVAGSGQEAHELVYEGVSYGGTIGPFQVRDPLVLGHFLGKETSRVAVGSFFRHTLAPTDLGLLPPMSVGMRDRTLDGSALHESIIYLATVMPRLALRGEAVNEDGSGGRLMAACDLLPHNHQTTTIGTANPAAVTVTLGTADPYRFHHASILLENEEVARVKDFEIVGDRGAQFNYYWNDDNNRRPREAPPQGARYDLRAAMTADGDTYGGGNRTVRDILRDRETVDMEFRFLRTTDQDEFRWLLTDVGLIEAPGQRPAKGQVQVAASGFIRQLRMTYVDANNSAFFPT